MARECPQATPRRWERTVEDKGQTVSQSEKEKEADDVTDEEEEEDGEAGIWTAPVKTVSAARILKSPNPISEKNSELIKLSSFSDLKSGCDVPSKYVLECSLNKLKTKGKEIECS